MALPPSGPISIQDIVNEFGGSGSHSLSEYYRGGAFVPNTPANAGIPTSGAISLADFYGAAAEPVVSFSGGSFIDSNPGAASMSLTWFNNGTWVAGGSTGLKGSGSWVEPGSAASDYEVRAQLIGGTLNSGTLNTWLDCANNHSWGVFSTSGSATATVRISVRKKGTATVLASADFTLTAQA